MRKTLIAVLALAAGLTLGALAPHEWWASPPAPQPTEFSRLVDQAMASCEAISDLQVRADCERDVVRILKGN